tara:strand:+ start:1656 stop:1973 length:318 start_codon:yes stop_codon:yes gene_type:complete
MKTKPFTADVSVDVDGVEVIVTCAYTYTPGSPAVYYQRNGDPGWPEECPEVEVVGMKVKDAEVPDWFYNAVMAGEKCVDWIMSHHEPEEPPEREYERDFDFAHNL